MGITITGHDIDVDDAARWLVEKYLPATVRFYDYADGDDYDGARSPVDTVTFGDLGRIVCIAGSLRFGRGHTLMEHKDAVPRVDVEVPDLGDIIERGDDFYRHPAVRAMWELFDFWDSRGGLGFGTVGKLLHIKWPHFVPITDSEFTETYRELAVDEHNASGLIRQELNSSKRTKSANVRCYWSVFRDDLVSSRDALAELRDALMSFDDPIHLGPSARGHVDRLHGLTDLRLLDALVWGVSADGTLG